MEPRPGSLARARVLLAKSPRKASGQSGLAQGHDRLVLAGGDWLGLEQVAGAAPGLMFLCGYRSVTTGAKARHLAAWAACQGRACTLFDYRGMGSSSGRFEEQTIGGWLDDALAVLDRATAGPLVLVGSSLGGWLAVLAAMRRPERVRGLVLLAPAPDFPQRLILPALDARERALLADVGRIVLPSRYGEPLPVHAELIAESAAHGVLGRRLPLAIPVHVLHGRMDPDVPWRISVELVQAMPGAAVTLEIVEDGDHRLSRPADLRRLELAVERVGRLAAAPRDGEGS